MHQSQKRHSLQVCCQDLENNWVIVGLTSTGEKETNIESIKKSARRLLKVTDIDIFVPAISQTVRGLSETVFYIQGYIFIKFRKNVQFLRLKDTSYFSNVLCRIKDKSIVYDLISDDEVNKIRKHVNEMKLFEYNVGDDIVVTKGSYKNLVGTVSCVYNEEKVQVAIILRSKQILMDFPCTYLKKNDKT